MLKSLFYRLRLFLIIYVGGRFRKRGSHAMVGEAKGARHRAGKLILRLCSIYDLWAVAWFNVLRSLYF